ncbi:septal ring lytic transglycosylase RlpA family protein [Parathalassolituus penaei]|nr:septal ring lytic transglycosylase RlpA family protein [Parathalassolituus penaei]
MKLALVLTAAALLLGGCSSTPENTDDQGYEEANKGRYQHDKDFRPDDNPDAESEPVPRSEPMSVNGNRPVYSVNGKTYRVVMPPANYSETGTASWYGMKFHGHDTASGEEYNVYRFTAAHKTLPIPSYVRVTRLDNKKSVVVKVNDRGPFHEDRIIDLSYAAARKLGVDISGTAPVRIDLLKAPLTQKVLWVQVSALADRNAAEVQKKELKQALAPMAWPVEIYASNKNNVNLHRVRIGPVPEGEPLQQLLSRLRQLSIDKPVLLTEPQL